MAELIRLRDLPGVQRVTDLCRNPRLFKYPQEAYTREEIDQISVQLFCITENDTLLFEDDPRLDEHEEEFEITEALWDEIRPFFEGLGWDVSDGKDNELLSAEQFMRQIIAVEKGLIEGACFKPDGTGAPAYDWEGERISDEDRLAERLKRDAEDWQRNRGGR